MMQMLGKKYKTALLYIAKHAFMTHSIFKIKNKIKIMQDNADMLHLVLKIKSFFLRFVLLPEVIQ